MARWGLDGMRSFEQANVAIKEGSRLSSAAPLASAGHLAADAGTPSQ
jgi:biotin synthase